MSKRKPLRKSVFLVVATALLTMMWSIHSMKLYTNACDAGDKLEPEAARALSEYLIWQQYGPRGSKTPEYEIDVEMLRKMEIRYVETPWSQQSGFFILGAYGMEAVLEGKRIAEFDLLINKLCFFSFSKDDIFEPRQSIPR